MCKNCDNNRVGVLRKTLCEHTGCFLLDGHLVPTQEAMLMLVSGEFVFSCISTKEITYVRKDSCDLYN